MKPKPAPSRDRTYPMIARPCVRCGNMFQPVWMGLIRYWTQTCQKCQVKNLADMVKAEVK